MIWQDLVLMLAGFVFAPSLLISIIKRYKYPLGTSLPTALALTVMVIVFITMNYYLAAFSTGMTALSWYILVIRR